MAPRQTSASDKGKPSPGLPGQKPHESAAPTCVERLAQARRLLASEGWPGISGRLRKRAATMIDPPGMQPLPLSRKDMTQAASVAGSGTPPPPPLPFDGSEPLDIAWVCVPQAAGGGGFTTVFRLMRALEQAGHRCTLYLHDRHGWSLDRHAQTMRAWWPDLQAPIRDAAAGIADAHAIFATSWETAYPVLISPARGARMYLIQDYEPAFHPAGSLSLLAEATYRFGFHGLTGGRWLAARLQREYGMQADHFDFGADLERYTLDESKPRESICTYARPSTPRRAVELAIAALDLFAERHPEIEIELYGERLPRLPFAAHQHGLLSPQQLGALYNRCIAGLSLSATNVSLVPLEMLAAGCIPVVNDAEQNRMVLDNAEVAYAPATPFDLANAICALVERPAHERQAAARAAALSVRSTSWHDAGVAIEQAVRNAVNAATHDVGERARVP